MRREGNSRGALPKKMAPGHYRRSHTLRETLLPVVSQAPFGFLPMIDPVRPKKGLRMHSLFPHPLDSRFTPFLPVLTAWAFGVCLALYILFGGDS
jgi:hypothetical protein